MRTAKGPAKFSGQETRYGFDWGPVEVRRTADLGPKLGVVLMLITKRERLDVRVTPGGRIRVEKGAT